MPWGGHLNATLRNTNYLLSQFLKKKQKKEKAAKCQHDRV